MNIRIININSPDYRELSIKIGCVFNTSEWLSIYDEKLKTYGIYNKGNELIGFFNLFSEKTKSISQLKNPPYSPTIALYYLNPSQNKAKKHSFDKSIYKLLEEFIAHESKMIVTITLPIVHKDMQVFIWKGYKVIPNYTYHLDIKNTTEEIISKNFSPERRNDIKKAIKDGVVCKISQDFSIVKEMVAHTYKRKGKEIKNELLDNILNKFANNSNSYSFVSYLNDKPIAASFIAYDNNTAFYLLGGYNPELKHQGAGAYAVEQSIYHAVKLGLNIFDFEGSMLPEVERYFRGFGGGMKIMYTINKAKLPIEMALKLIDRSRF